MKILGLYALVWTLAGTLYAAFGPALVEPPRMVKQAAPWSLPEMRKAEIESPLLYVREHMPWGSPPPPPGLTIAPDPPVPATKPNWRILAAVSAGEDSYVAVQIGKLPSTEIKIGQFLPDGSQVMRIDSDRLYLNIKGKKRILRLYPE